MKEPKLDNYSLEAWIEMVEYAKKELKGSCQLLEDEVIVDVNELLMYHSSQIREAFEVDNEG